MLVDIVDVAVRDQFGGLPIVALDQVRTNLWADSAYLATSSSGTLAYVPGGRNSPGRWAGLAASFTELGIDLDTAKKFGPIVIDYVRHHGGENLVGKMRAALKL